MKRSEPPKRKAPLKRSNLKRKPRKASPAMKRARSLAVERAEGLCEARWTGCSARGEHAHHIRRRSQGGEDVVENLLIVCQSCHGAIHANPALAHQKGHLKLSKDA